MDLSLKNQYIICPVCHGTGATKAGFSCPECAGLGTGTFYLGKFFYWGPRLGRAVIELDHIRKKMHMVLNLLAYAVAVAGLLSLAFWVFLASETASTYGEFAFWRISHPLILAFWIGLGACLFIYYRMSEEERQKVKIKPLKYEERNRDLSIPNNWTELKQAKSSRKMDVARGYTDPAVKVVEDAYLLADKLNHEWVTAYHLFFSALSDKQVAAIFSRLNVDAGKLIEMTKAQIEKMPATKERTKLSKTVKRILVDAYLSAYRLGQKKVTPKNLLIPCLEHDGILQEILYDLEVDRNKIFNVILWFIINERQVEAYKKYKQMARFKPSGNMDRAYTSVATPVLNQVGYDLTAAAKWNKLEYCVAREAEIGKIWQHLESGKNGILLVGPPGVGKNTVIDGIAQLMVKEDVPKFLQDKRLVELDASRLISGSDASAAQGRLLQVIDEVNRAGNIVLFIRDIENMIGVTAGGEQSLDLAEVLSGAIERRHLYCFASVTRENFVKYVESQSLGQVFSVVDIEEPEGNQAIQIIESKISFFEGKYQIYFSYNAIEQVIKMTARYIRDKYLPEKAINVLEMVAVKVSQDRGANAVVGAEDIARVISDQTGIPVTKVGEEEGRNLLKLEDRIHERMINQKEAVKMVAASLRRARAELREGTRPIANFLFLGPTGVGKTELAKSVSEVYFGDEDYMIRVDMSEYQHQDSVKKMIGDASGAKGYLTEKVRKQPFALILLDEIEKAHKDILNLFLQVMDDGRLTDGQGRTIDFTSSILIATSNAGAEYIQQAVRDDVGLEEMKKNLVNEHLINVMRPELVNRFDGVIVFEPLSMENVVDIAHLMLSKIARMLDGKGIGFKAEEEGVRLLAREGFDPKFGARPLRRLLQDKVEDKIANKILAGELQRRDTVVINQRGSVAVEKGRAL